MATSKRRCSSQPTIGIARTQIVLQPKPILGTAWVTMSFSPLTSVQSLVSHERSYPFILIACTVARSLAAGGYIPGLTAAEPSKDYDSWKGDDGTSYSLIETDTLSAALKSLGWTYVGSDPTAASVVPGCVVFGNAYHTTDPMAHTCIVTKKASKPGGMPQATCHNAALQNRPVTPNVFKFVTKVQCPP